MDYLRQAKEQLDYIPGAYTQGAADAYTQMAIAAAAIAQAEAAERQAQAMERIAAMLESTLSPAAFNRRFIGVETLDKAF